jgi:hypothetical protein
VIVAGDEHDGNSLLFTSPGGSPLRHTNFRIRVWLPALRAAGLPTIHFHDLRHTGNMFAADAGAGLRELMDRMGHSTTRAALTYLHGSDERQRAIAEALSSLTAAELKRRDTGRSGTEAPERLVKIAGGCGRMRVELGLWVGAPSAIRTRDLLLRRHSPDVGRCGWMWPDVALCCTGNG